MTVYIDLQAAKSASVHRLAFNQLPLLQRQARFLKRTVLEPQIQLDDYACNAVIDWAEIHFHLDRPTQGRHVQHLLEETHQIRCFAKPLGANPSVCGEFVVRIQEPSTDLLKDVVGTIETEWGVTRLPTLEGLEIAVDFKPRVHSEVALARMYGVLIRTHLPKRDVLSVSREGPRFAWGRGLGQTEHVLGANTLAPTRRNVHLLDPDMDRPAKFDATYYVGARGSPSAWRTMIKVQDEFNKGANIARALPVEEHRVRIEVTLGASELQGIGLDVVKELSAGSYRRLQGAYFQFFLPTFPSGPPRLAKMAAIHTRIQADRIKRFCNAGVLGLQAMDEAKRKQAMQRKKTVSRRIDGARLPPLPRAGVGRTGSFIAYKPLCRIVTRALEALARREG